MAYEAGDLVVIRNDALNISYRQSVEEARGKVVQLVDTNIDNRNSWLVAINNKIIIVANKNIAGELNDFPDKLAEYVADKI